MPELEQVQPALELSCGDVLVIDDSELLVELVAEALRGNGYRVRTATCGPDGLEMARANPPDLVVSDLHMPGMDGLGVLSGVRDLDPTIPVILLSGDDEIGAVLAAVREGAFDYVIKTSGEMRPLFAAVDRALCHVRLTRENRVLNDALRTANQTLELRLDQLDEKHRELQREQRRSEELLLNILPGPVAERLKNTHEPIADGFPDVTVMFIDIAGFTRLATERSPAKLVAILNEVFSGFDRLAEIHGLEKIKTIGDAYMVAAGLPTESEDHAEAIADMALDIIGQTRSGPSTATGRLQFRIGINTGPVVAGVIGEKKFIYDLWGDTVNVASRMEAHGLPGEIQITEATRRRLGDSYLVTPRGEIEVRGKGRMQTFLLAGRRGA